MEPHNSVSPNDLQSALDEVRRIRDLVERTRMSHPIRYLLRPLMFYVIALAPLVVIYGIVSQWILDAETDNVLGLSKDTLLWVFGAASLVFISVIKAVVPWIAFHRDEQELLRILRKIYTADYFRVVLPVVCLAAAACVAMAQAGNAHQIMGLITAAVGVVWMMATLMFPLPEYPPISIFLIVTGILSIFILPAYPFYKLAVVWGIALFALGILGLRVSKQFIQE